MTEVVHLVVARRGVVHYCHSSLPVLLSLHSACTVIRLPPLITTNYCLMSPCSMLGPRAVQYKGSFVHCCVASKRIRPIPSPPTNVERETHPSKPKLAAGHPTTRPNGAYRSKAGPPPAAGAWMSCTRTSSMRWPSILVIDQCVCSGCNGHLSVTLPGPRFRRSPHGATAPESSQCP